ncbi:MAG: hypothetical protein JOZ67_04955 [Gammaproteobacteria bacterium]|nr:hypothetical protein [Gammaproteobacteria bacterium]MBV9697448.1 hypothetical protein [Gammaproteobacteria bacterium]
MQLASLELAAADVDLIVSNQSHRVWRRALRANLFLPGAVQFRPGTLGDSFAPGIELADLHVNRGDGDGPIHL